MEWARTLRIDAAPGEALEERLSSCFSREGVTLRLGGSRRYNRTYVLAQGGAGVDPAEIDWSACGARAYDEAVIALAIEPSTPDALPLLARALGGDGAPAGIRSCDVEVPAIVVEFAPSVTPAPLILRLVDVELRRLSGTRRIDVLSPLSLDMYAQIAAQGLECPDLAPDRVLEHVIGRGRVE